MLLRDSLTLDELARNMSQSTSSRDACSIASEWRDQRVTSLSTGGSWAILCLYSVWWKMAAWSDLPKSRQVSGLCRHFWAECSKSGIQVSGWTGYKLMNVRQDLLEVGFVKVSGDDEGSVRMFVVISLRHIVKIGQGQAVVSCLWWNVDRS